MSVRSSLKFLLCQCLRTLTSLYHMIPRQGLFLFGVFSPWVYVAQEVWINLAVNWFYKNDLDSEGKRRAWSRQYRMWGPFNHIWQGVQMKHYSEKIESFTLLQSSANRGTLVLPWQNVFGSIFKHFLNEHSVQLSWGMLLIINTRLNRLCIAHLVPDMTSPYMRLLLLLLLYPLYLHYIYFPTESGRMVTTFFLITCLREHLL